MDKQGHRRLKAVKRVGLVVVITGKGKGKTTSALGMALRAVGHGMKVCMIHFIKGNLYSGEMEGIKRLYPDVEAHVTGKGFCGIRGDSHSFREHREAAQSGIKLAREKMGSGRFDILILDEINNALKLELIDLDQVIDLIDKKPPLMHLILTGRDAHPEVIKRADTVSEILDIKHPYHEGVEPQPGVDY